MTSSEFTKPQASPEAISTRLDPAVEPLAVKLAEISQQLDELRALVAGKKEEIITLFKAATLLTRERAARQLSMSVSQLDRQAAKGTIEETIIDRRPRYSLVDLEQFIAARRTPRGKRLKRQTRCSRPYSHLAGPDPAAVSPKPYAFRRRAKCTTRSRDE